MAIDTTQALFGSSSATSIFAVGLSASSNTTPQQQIAQTTIDSSEREIKRIRGYKEQLTPAENQRLFKIQERIHEIETKATEGTIRPDEVEERSELYLEADAIIGKPSADVENDATLADYSSQIEELLAPKLNPSNAARLKRLENYRTSLQNSIADGDDTATTRNRLQGVIKQINDVNVPREVHTLSVSEQKQYDELVELVNNHAGAKLVLNAKESKRVYDLQQSISQLSSLLPADTSGQPTAAAVARAYTRLG